MKLKYCIKEWNLYPYPKPKKMIETMIHEFSSVLHILHVDKFIGYCDYKAYLLNSIQSQQQQCTLSKS